MKVEHSITEALKGTLSVGERDIIDPVQTLPIDDPNSRCLTVPMFPGSEGFENATLHQLILSGNETVVLDTAHMSPMIGEGTAVIEDQQVSLVATSGLGVVARLTVVVPTGSEQPISADEMNAGNLAKDIEAGRVEVLEPLYVGVNNLSALLVGLRNNPAFANGQDISRENTLQRVIELAGLELTEEGEVEADNAPIACVVVGEQSFFDDRPVGVGVALLPHDREKIWMHGVRHDEAEDILEVTPIEPSYLQEIARGNSEHKLFLGVTHDQHLVVSGPNTYDPENPHRGALPGVIVEMVDPAEPIDINPMGELVAPYLESRDDTANAVEQPTQIIDLTKDNKAVVVDTQPEAPIEPTPAHMTHIDEEDSAPLDAGDKDAGQNLTFNFSVIQDQLESQGFVSLPTATVGRKFARFSRRAGRGS